MFEPKNELGVIVETRDRSGPQEAEPGAETREENP